MEYSHYFNVTEDFQYRCVILILIKGISYQADSKIQKWAHVYNTLKPNVCQAVLLLLLSCFSRDQPHRRQPTRLSRPWDSPGKNTGVGCHFLLRCMKVKSKSEVTQSCPTLSNPMDCSPPGPSIHGIFQARVLGWVAIAFSSIELHGDLIGPSTLLVCDVGIYDLIRNNHLTFRTLQKMLD